MSWVAKREALDGGDLDNWAQYEQAHNHLAIGANTIDLFVSAGTLYARKGKIGLFDDTQYYAITNSGDAAISLAGLTASCWAKVEISVSGGSTVVVAIASIAGDTNPCKLPATFLASYDPTKGGYYIAATKRCAGVVFIDAGGVPTSIVNATAPVERKRSYDSPFPLFCSIPWMKNLAAYAQVALFSGTCTTDLSMALKDTGASFTTVTAGDIVQNTASKAFAIVLYKISTDTLMLDADVFPAGNETYKVWAQPILAEQEGMAGFIELTGAKLDGNGTVAADTNTVNHLLDADGTAWTGLVNVGNWAMNLATGLVAQVMVVGNHDLTLQWDAFPNGNEKYMIYASKITIADAESPINGAVIPEANIGGRFFGGGLISGRAEDDQELGHLHGSAHTGFITGPGSGVTAGSGLLAGTFVDAGTSTATTDGVYGIPRIGDHIQPRTIRATMILRIK